MQTNPVPAAPAVCPEPSCGLFGQTAGARLTVHQRRRMDGCVLRYRCLACGTTFAPNYGTAFHGLRAPVALVVCVVTLVAYGCPLQAIVAAFGLDERTVASWLRRAGHAAQGVHQQVVQTGRVAGVHVQADELWAKLAGARVWVAMALEATTRLWLGGMVSAHRDTALLRQLGTLARSCLRSGAVLLCVDGLASYPTQFTRAFRERVLTGRRGRPRLRLPAGFLLGQVVKRRVRRCLIRVDRRALVGTVAAIEAVLHATGTGQGIHTAYIERLNATFRASLACLARRSRTVLHSEQTLSDAMWLVGGVYNFVRPHRSLRGRNPAPGPRWLVRTPAMAAGLTDHVWSVGELLNVRLLPRTRAASVVVLRPPLQRLTA